MASARRRASKLLIAPVCAAATALLASCAHAPQLELRARPAADDPAAARGAWIAGHTSDALPPAGEWNAAGFGPRRGVHALLDDIAAWTRNVRVSGESLLLPAVWSIDSISSGDLVVARTHPGDVAMMWARTDDGAWTKRGPPPARGLRGNRAFLLATTKGRLAGAWRVDTDSLAPLAIPQVALHFPAIDAQGHWAALTDDALVFGRVAGNELVEQGRLDAAEHREAIPLFALLLNRGVDVVGRSAHAVTLGVLGSGAYFGLPDGSVVGRDGTLLAPSLTKEDPRHFSPRRRVVYDSGACAPPGGQYRVHSRPPDAVTAYEADGRGALAVRHARSFAGPPAGPVWITPDLNGVLYRKQVRGLASMAPGAEGDWLIFHDDGTAWRRIGVFSGWGRHTGWIGVP